MSGLSMLFWSLFYFFLFGFLESKAEAVSILYLFLEMCIGGELEVIGPLRRGNQKHQNESVEVNLTGGAEVNPSKPLLTLDIELQKPRKGM